MAKLRTNTAVMGHTKVEKLSVASGGGGGGGTTSNFDYFIVGQPQPALSGTIASGSMDYFIVGQPIGAIV
jgi:hypothetical protein